MSDQIIIDGGLVKRVRYSEEALCSTEQWIKRLTEVYPATRDIVPGQLAIAISEESTIYHIGFKPRIAQSMQNIHGERKFNMLLPTSVFSVLISKRNSVSQIFWHLIMGKFEDVPFDQLTPVKNFFPNVGSTNDLCPGGARITHDDKRPLRHTINKAIASVIDSPYNFDLFRADDYSKKFRKGITEWRSKEAAGAISKKLEKATEELRKLEMLKYETMTAPRKKEAMKKRESLMTIRRNALTELERLSQPSQWRDHLFPYFESWTEKHKDLIDEDPHAASDLLITEASAHVQTGAIMNNGVFSHG